ncbi:MAG TPA: BON domain-containing protein [Thermomicrobiaceae bacterium]|nr:BON domain-containing protein [Thermomicrobiaceae bacterium]
MVANKQADAELQQDVIDELDWDPEVDVTDVGVEVDDGVITLTGTVHDYQPKWAAERAALRVAGVRAVANDIAVRPLRTRTDTDIARDIADALQRSLAEEVAGHIDVRVESTGPVILDGEVRWGYQRLAAERAARQVKGVTAVTNLIRVTQPSISAAEIRSGIQRAFVRNAQLDANNVRVWVDGSCVTLSGTVRSASERREAEAAAWRAAGVVKVNDQIRVNP